MRGGSVTLTLRPTISCERFATFHLTANRAGQVLNSFTAVSVDAAGDGLIYACTRKGAGIPSFDCGTPPDFPAPAGTSDAGGRQVSHLCAGPDITGNSIEFIRFTYMYREGSTPTCGSVSVPAPGSEWLDNNLNNYTPDVQCVATTSAVNPC